MLEAPPRLVFGVARQMDLAVLRDDRAARVDQHRGVEAAYAAVFVRQFRITEIETDAERARRIEQALRIRPRQNTLEEGVDLVLPLEVPAREKRRQRQL